MILAKKETYKIRVFRAIDEEKTCIEYLAGHVKVLADYGITNVTSNNAGWMKNPFVYCIVAERESGGLVGGIRVQVAEGETPLPVEEAINYIDFKIHEKIRHYALNGGVGELCGLWVSNELKGLGMSRYLVRSAISSANQLNFKTLTGICAGYTLAMFRNVGFMIDTSLGDEGSFSYPTDEYIANVVGILDAITLESANEFDKVIMISLRRIPLQTRMEKETGNKVKIDYELVYERTTAMRLYGDFSYQHITK
jgi:hypothetical protein